MHKRSYHQLLLTILFGFLVSFPSLASNQIEIHLSPPTQANSTEIFFQQDNDWSPIYTDAEKLKVVGNAENLDVTFLLLSVNERQFPLSITKHAFEKMVPLEPGINTFTVSTNLMDILPAESVVYKVEPAKILRVVNQFEGGVDQTIDLPAIPPEGTTAINLQSPVVRIIGQKGTEGIVKLKVKDSYRNTLPVESLKDGIFAVNYTLREKSSHLTFLSTLQNRTLETMQLNLHLEDMIVLDFQSEQVPSGWIFQGPEHPHPICQLDTALLQGRIQAVEEGEVELMVGNKSTMLPVKDHLFTAAIPLSLNSLTRGRVRLKLNEQSFFESYQIEQKEPTVKIFGLHQMVLDGSLFQPAIELHPAPGVPLKLRECMLQLRGSAHFYGELSLVLERLPDGKRIPIEINSRKFSSTILLEVGTHSYNLLLEGGGFSRPYYSFDVNVHPGIKVEAVNYIPYSKGKMKLMRDELILRGIVYGIKRGLMQMKLGGETYPIPILEGQFEMDKAIKIPAGSSAFTLTLREGDSAISRDYEFEIDALAIPDIQHSEESTTEMEEESDSVDQESNDGS